MHVVSVGHALCGLAMSQKVKPTKSKSHWGLLENDLIGALIVTLVLVIHL